MGVTEEVSDGSGKAMQDEHDLEDAVLLAIKATIPCGLNPVRFRAIRQREWSDVSEKRQQTPRALHGVEHGTAGAGIFLSDLYCILFYDEQDAPRILTSKFRNIERETRALEDKMSTISDAKAASAALSDYLKTTRLPVEVAEFLYKKITGKGIEGLVVGEDRRFFNNNMNLDLEIAARIAEDVIKLQPFVVFAYSHAQEIMRGMPIHFYFTEPYKYARIDSVIFNAFISKALSKSGNSASVTGVHISVDLLVQHVYDQGASDQHSSGPSALDTHHTTSVEASSAFYGFRKSDLENAKVQAINYHDYFAYALACSFLGQQPDFGVLDGFIRSVLPEYTPRNTSTCAHPHENTHKNAHNIPFILSSIVYGQMVGYKNDSLVLKLVSTLVEGDADSLKEQFLFGKIVNILSSVSSRDPEKAAPYLVRCLAIADGDNRAYKELCEAAPNLRIGHDDKQGIYTGLNEKELYEKLQAHKQGYIAEQNYYLAFLLNRTLGGTLEEFVAEIVRGFVEEHKDDEHKKFVEEHEDDVDNVRDKTSDRKTKARDAIQTFLMRTGEGNICKISVRKEDMQKGYAAESVVRYVVSFETEEETRSVVIKQNKNGIISGIESKLCPVNTNIAHCGRYVVMSMIQGKRAIDVFKKGNVNYPLIINVIDSIARESERINSIRLSDEERAYIQAAQARREEGYKSAVHDQLGALGVRIWNELEAVRKEIFSRTPPLLLKDANPTNIMIEGAGEHKLVTHFDYNYLNFGHIDQEYVVFMDSWGCCDEDRRCSFVSAMRKQRRMSTDEHNNFYRMGFVENMLKYGAFVQRAKEEGISKDDKEHRWKVAAFKFHRALDMYSRSSKRDDLLLKEMTTYYLTKMCR